MKQRQHYITWTIVALRGHMVAKIIFIVPPYTAPRWPVLETREKECHLDHHGLAGPYGRQDYIRCFYTATKWPGTTILPTNT